MSDEIEQLRKDYANKVEAYGEASDEVERLLDENGHLCAVLAELVEAVEFALPYMHPMPNSPQPVSRIRAALAKAKEQK